MRTPVSSGLLMYKLKEGVVYYFIGHPGGPFFIHKDEGTWSIPKGEVDEGETLLETAQREFKEETGIDSHGPYIPLDNVVLKSGKRVHAWAFEGEWSGLLMSTSQVSLEWPRGSGRTITFPEIDRAGFFPEKEAKRRLNPAQAIFIDRLKKIITV